ncbi:dihydropteroate synthase [Pseudogemmobacter sonorensis]|uniref:dihydropteroate synthase n=1 Tax=Pseudogemmobacter sonorensis TaxID=2989681 RepID=UPI0036A111B7
MTTRFQPVPMTHRRSDGAWPLAGSRHVWWEAGTAIRDGCRAEYLRAGEMDPGLCQRLSARRADLCGLALDRPRIMGILNVTPDSFSDGGRHQGPEAALARARVMAQEADILDIGGESTRPGADDVPEGEEIARTAPVIRALRAAGIANPISIDTRKARVAAAALEAGADIVNDVTALRFDPDMARVVAEAGAPVVLMHSLADPRTMNDHASYRDVVAEVHEHLAERIEAALAAGIAQDRIITDPGIGFAKTAAHNLALIRDLAAFHDLGCPVLLGASRKRFIGEIGGADRAPERMAGSVAVALAGAAAGAQILRVHDTYETRQALRLWQALAGDNEKDGNGAEHDA